MSTTKPRFSITLDPELFDKVDDFRFQNRFQSRSQAAVELIRKGLEAIEKEKEEKTDN